MHLLVHVTGETWYASVQFAAVVYLLYYFSAKSKIVVWDYFHIQYYSSFEKAYNGMNQKYV